MTAQCSAHGDTKSYLNHSEQSIRSRAKCNTRSILHHRFTRSLTDQYSKYINKTDRAPRKKKYPSAHPQRRSSQASTKVSYFEYQPRKSSSSTNCTPKLKMYAVFTVVALAAFASASPVVQEYPTTTPPAYPTSSPSLVTCAATTTITEEPTCVEPTTSSEDSYPTTTCPVLECPYQPATTVTEPCPCPSQVTTYTEPPCPSQTTGCVTTCPTTGLTITTTATCTFA